jgi:hypothetical protein
VYKKLPVKLFFRILSTILNYKIIKQRFGTRILLPSSGTRKGKKKTYSLSSLVQRVADLDLCFARKRKHNPAAEIMLYFL